MYFPAYHHKSFEKVRSPSSVVLDFINNTAIPFIVNLQENHKTVFVRVLGIREARGKNYSDVRSQVHCHYPQEQTFFIYCAISDASHWLVSLMVLTEFYTREWEGK